MLARLQQNTPRLHIDAPLLLAQGLADPLVVPAVQLDYVRSLCDAGQEVDYLTVPGEDHVGLVTADSPSSPQLITWTRARLAGDSPPPADVISSQLPDDDVPVLAALLQPTRSPLLPTKLESSVV